MPARKINSKTELHTLSTFDFAVSQQAIKEQFNIAPIASEETEATIIGALISDSDAISKVKNFLEPKHFYNEKNKDTYSGILQMVCKNIPIDLRTITEFFLNEKVTYIKEVDGKNTKYKGNLLEKIGGAFELVEYTNKVASTANIEYHARMIEMKFLHRESITHFYKAIQEIQEIQIEDIYDFRNTLADKLRVQSRDAYLQIRNLNQVIEDARDQPEQLRLIGDLWLKGQVAILYGESGTGKSVLAYQIGECIAAGIDLIPDLLKNECERQKVLYFDFELSDRQILKRYADPNSPKSFQFDENFVRASVNRDFLNYKNSMDVFVMAQIEEAIAAHKPDVIILDNITYIAEEANDASVAIRIMKRIKQLTNRYDLSTLVLGHTPKRDHTQPITQDHLSGSKNIANFCDTMFALGKDANDPLIKYIKQTKFRDVEEFFNENNVIKTVIDKDTDMFLRHRYVELIKESTMLLKLYDDETEKSMISEAAKLKVEQGYSWRQLQAYYNNRWSHQTIRRKVTKYIEEEDLSGLAEKEKSKQAT